MRLSYFTLFYTDILLSEELLTCSKTSQKSKIIDALKKCNNNCVIFVTVARLLERSNKVAKARKYYTRALNINSRYGDAYIYYYIFEYLQLYKKRLINEGLLNNIKSTTVSVTGGANIDHGVVAPHTGDDLSYASSSGATDIDGIDDEEEAEETVEEEVRLSFSYCLICLFL